MDLACALRSLRCPMPPYAESFREALAEHMREVLPIKRPSINLHIARNSAQVSIISTAMKTKFHRARGKPGLFAARRLSLRHCHRMLTASIVASSSLIVPLAVFKPAWPEEIEKARREPEPSKCNCSQFPSKRPYCWSRAAGQGRACLPALPRQTVCRRISWFRFITIRCRTR